MHVHMYMCVYVYIMCMYMYVSTYLGTMNNKGAFIILRSDLKPEIIQFYAQSIGGSFKRPDSIDGSTSAGSAKKRLTSEEQSKTRYVIH